MRNLPNIYNQRDPQWASQRLGTVNGATIGQYGCYVTSLSIKANYYGHNVTPAQLDDLFTNGDTGDGKKTFYANGNLCTDDILQKVFPDCQYQKTYDFSSAPADLNLLKTLLADPTLTVTIEVDFDHNPNDGIQTHFMEAVDCDGSNVTVEDPWYGSVDNMTKNYGNNPAQTILKFVVYKGNPVAQPQALNTYGIDPTNTASVQVVYDTWHDVSQGKYVNKSDYDAKVKSLQDTIDNLNGITKDKDQQIASLQTQVSSLESQVTSLTQAKETAEGIAKQVPTLQAELTQAQGDRSTCLAAQEGQNKKIATLQQMVDAKKPKGFWNKLLYLLT